MRLTETYLALGVPDEAKKSAAVLGANYPGTQWYDRAYKLMRENPGVALAAVPPGQPIVPVQGATATPTRPGSNDVAPKDDRSAAPTPGNRTGT